MKQYNRQYRLDLSHGLGLVAATLSINNLRVEFQIKKTIDSTPNPASIKIWNLNPQHRYQIASGLFPNVKLYAGYEKPQLIYSGNIVSARSQRSGLDIIVELECGDGHQDYQQSFYSGSIQSGHDDQQILQSLAKKFGSVETGTLAVTQKQAITRGKVLHGATRDLLNNIATKQKADWSIQNGELVFLPAMQVLKAPVTVISQQTGMVGSPMLIDNGLEVSCLLNPTLQIGSLVQVESIDPSFNGNYKVVSLTHQGDAIGGNWLTKLQLHAGDFQVVMGGIL